MQDSTNLDLKDTLVICHLDALVRTQQISGNNTGSASLAPLVTQLKNQHCTSVVLFISELLTQHSFSRLKAAKTKLEEEEEEEEKLTVQVITPSDFLHGENQLPDKKKDAKGIKEQLGAFEWSFDENSAFNRAERNGSVRELKNGEKNAVHEAQPSGVMVKEFLNSLPEDNKKVLIISHVATDLMQCRTALSTEQKNTSSGREISTLLVLRAGIKVKKHSEYTLEALETPLTKQKTGSIQKATVSLSLTYDPYQTSSGGANPLDDLVREIQTQFPSAQDTFTPHRPTLLHETPQQTFTITVPCDTFDALWTAYQYLKNLKETYASTLGINEETNQKIVLTGSESLLSINYSRWPGILLFVITLIGALPAITGLCCEQAAHAPDWWAQCTQWVAKTLGDNALHHTLWPASLGVAGAGLFGLAIYFLYKQSFESKKRELENADYTPPNPGAN
jgi:hypothetical protein